MNNPVSPATHHNEHPNFLIPHAAERSLSKGIRGIRSWIFYKTKKLHPSRGKILFITVNKCQ